jgi:hypothetical protein
MSISSISEAATTVTNLLLLLFSYLKRLVDSNIVRHIFMFEFRAEVYVLAIFFSLVFRFSFCFTSKESRIEIK